METKTESKREYIMIGILVILCLFIGWIGRGAVENNKKLELNTSMAWGFDEANQNWNRIRVDEKGYVICHKE